MNTKKEVLDEVTRSNTDIAVIIETKLRENDCRLSTVRSPLYGSEEGRVSKSSCLYTNKTIGEIYKQLGVGG